LIAADSVRYSGGYQSVYDLKPYVINVVVWAFRCGFSLKWWLGSCRCGSKKSKGSCKFSVLLLYAFPSGLEDYSLDVSSERVKANLWYVATARNNMYLHIVRENQGGIREVCRLNPSRD
jgi:hypothetical protein